MRRAWSKRSFAVACALVVVGIAPLACLIGWSFYGNDSPVSMPIPLRHGTYSSPWFTTRIQDLYELDLGTTRGGRSRLTLTGRLSTATATA